MTHTFTGRNVIAPLSILRTLNGVHTLQFESWITAKAAVLFIAMSIYTFQRAVFWILERGALNSCETRPY